MADGDIVRRITISATGENIDSTKSSVEALGAATAALQALSEEAAARAAEESKAYDQQVNSLDASTESHNALYSVLKNTTMAVVEGTLAYYAHVAAVQVALTIFKTALGIFFELYLAYKLIKETIGLVTEAWRLGGEELQKYVQISQNAGNLSVEFSQRIAKAAADAKIPLDDLT